MYIVQCPICKEDVELEDNDGRLEAVCSPCKNRINTYWNSPERLRIEKELEDLGVYDID